MGKGNDGFPRKVVPLGYKLLQLFTAETKNMGTAVTFGDGPDGN